MGFGPLVGVDWLAEHLHHAGLVVADVRWYLDGRDGREAYRTGHIPGAVFVDLTTELAAPPGPGGAGGRHPLPTPEAFAAAMAAHGINDRSRVVAYDDAGGAVAARLWWMLRATGHDAAVLDGGIAEWRGHLVVGDETRAPAGTFTPRPWPPSMLATADEVAEVAARDGGMVVDARAAERYRGEVEPIDPKAGHIPGAVNVPWSSNLLDGVFLPAGELADRYRAAGVLDADDVVVSCGSGVNACHDILALSLAGRDDARLYVGSWSEWSSDDSRPVATGDAP